MNIPAKGALRSIAALALIAAALAPGTARAQRIAPVAAEVAPLSSALGSGGGVAGFAGPSIEQPLASSLSPALGAGLGTVPTLVLPDAVPALRTATVKAAPAGIVSVGGVTPLNRAAAKAAPKAVAPALKVIEGGGAARTSLDVKEMSGRLGGMFDGSEAVEPYLRPEWDISFDAGKLAEYRNTLQRASLGEGDPEEKALVDRAADLAESAGITIERRTYRIDNASYHGFRVVAEAGGSPLNAMAARVKESLGASVDYVPGKRGGATAMYNEHDGHLYLPEFDHGDAYPAILHEMRHAYYAALKQKGDLRLFHMAALAHRGLKLSPKAEAYTGYLSFEELSTYPKTLRHLVSRARGGANPEARARALKSLKSRTRQYVDIMRTATFLAGGMKNMAEGGALSPEALSLDSRESRHLVAPPGGRNYALRMPNARVFVPVIPAERKRDWLDKLLGRGPRLEEDAYALRAALIRELVEENLGTVQELMDLLDESEPRLASAQMLTNRLVVSTLKKDEKFVRSYAEAAK